MPSAPHGGSLSRWREGGRQRKLSGFTVPSKTNDPAFRRAVKEVVASATVLNRSLTTASAPRDREAEAVKAKARSATRFRLKLPD